MLKMHKINVYECHKINVYKCSTSYKINVYKCSEYENEQFYVSMHMCTLKIESQTVFIDDSEDVNCCSLSKKIIISIGNSTVYCGIWE